MPLSKVCRVPNVAAPKGEASPYSSASLRNGEQTLRRSGEVLDGLLGRHADARHILEALHHLGADTCRMFEAPNRLELDPGLRHRALLDRRNLWGAAWPWASSGVRLVRAPQDSDSPAISTGLTVVTGTWSHLAGANQPATRRVQRTVVAGCAPGRGSA